MMSPVVRRAATIIRDWGCNYKGLGWDEAMKTPLRFVKDLLRLGEIKLRILLQCCELEMQCLGLHLHQIRMMWKGKRKQDIILIQSLVVY